MQSSIQNLDGLQREVTITVPVEEVKAAYQKRLAEVAKKANVNGFRPGKVPTSVVDQQYGKSVLGEIAGQLMQDNFEKVLKDEKIRIAGPPTVGEYDIKKDAPFEFKATFEVYPEFELKDLTNVKLDRETAEITDADFEGMLEKLQKQHAEYAIVEREAKTGDRVVIDFEGSVNGEIFEGGVAKEHTLELGSNTMIPGFEAGIIGMNIGDTKDIKVTFPETYQSEDLQGKEAVFNITLHKVEAAELAPVDDALAEKMKIEGGVEALKTKVREGMVRELAERLKSRFKETVFDALLEANPIDVPKALVDAEIKHLKRANLQRMASQFGMPIEQLEKLDLPDDPHSAEADKRVRIGLLLSEVVKKYEVKPGKEALNARIKELAAYYEKPEDVEKWYTTNKEALAEIEAALYEEECVEKLTADAKVTDKAITYADIADKPQQ